MPLILDVRTPEEIAEGYLEGALFADFNSDNFRERLLQLDKTADYIVHCRSGQRSENAVQAMTELGFTGELVNAGGLEDAATITRLNIISQ